MNPDAQIYPMSILPTPHGPQLFFWEKYRALLGPYIGPYLYSAAGMLRCFATPITTGEAKGPDVAADPMSGTVVVAATIDNAEIAVLTGPDPREPLFNLPLPPADAPRFVPAVAFLGRPDAIGAVYIQGTGDAGRIQVAILGSVPVETATTTVAEGKLPPYGPAIAWGKGTLVAAWTERVDEGQFAVFTAAFE